VDCGYGCTTCMIIYKPNSWVSHSLYCVDWSKVSRTFFHTIKQILEAKASKSDWTGSNVPSEHTME
jgi:hypothetical protein